MGKRSKWKEVIPPIILGGISLPIILYSSYQVVSTNLPENRYKTIVPVVQSNKSIPRNTAPVFTLVDRHQLTCLAKAIYFEARSESIAGQIAVAQVILNRVKSNRWPNTICGVVFQGEHRKYRCQFSFACDGKSDTPVNIKAYQIAYHIAYEGILGRLPKQVDNRTYYYHADYVSPEWKSKFKSVAYIGSHRFYSD